MPLRWPISIESEATSSGKLPDLAKAFGGSRSAIHETNQPQIAIHIRNVKPTASVIRRIEPMHPFVSASDGEVGSGKRRADSGVRVGRWPFAETKIKLNSGL